MNPEQYKPFFDAFEPAAKNKLTELAGILSRQYGRVVTDVELIDHDVDQGFGFMVNNNRQLFVELMLTDGDEYGFEGVGLILTCSVMGTGQVWAPDNYTPLVGTTDHQVICDRLAAMDVKQVACSIQDEWISVEVAQEAQADAG